MDTKIEYTAIAKRWFDKINGNTYHSVRVIRNPDGKTIYQPFTYGYGDSYRQSALEVMLKEGWLPKEYTDKNKYMFERENNYPIYWDCSDGLKRDCVANGKD